MTAPDTPNKQNDEGASEDCPYLSVIVPAHNGEAVLPRCIDALLSSELPRSEWELIMVDDASTDGTLDLAKEAADKVVKLDGLPHGPGYGRNRGVEVALGEIAIFVDADVCVHPDVLTRFAGNFRAHPELTAVFGAYDNKPEVPGFISQYRNLLHRYVHLRDAGAASTFWAGCGAVRISAFREVDGFQYERYPRPQIEDIDLGYRLTDKGYSIVIDPEIQAKHLKRWTFKGMVCTDIFDRGIPWMKLLLERGPKVGSDTLNLRPTEKIKTALVGLALLLLAASMFFQAPLMAAAAGFALVCVVVMSFPLYQWFWRERGFWFTLGVVPFQMLYYLINGVSAAGGFIHHYLASRTA